MQTLFQITSSILIIFLIGACNLPGFGRSDLTLTTTPVTAPSTETIEPVEPSQDNESVECAFMWANDPLPELSSDLDEALKGFQSEAEGYAQAYGENCVTNEGEIVRFLAMETDYYITLKVEDLGDKQALGELIEGVMEVMAEFPTDETPGPQPGYIGITFKSNTDSFRLWAPRTNIEAAMREGLRGEELFNSLQTQ